MQEKVLPEKRDERPQQLTAFSTYRWDGISDYAAQ